MSLTKNCLNFHLRPRPVRAILHHHHLLQNLEEEVLPFSFYISFELDPIVEIWGTVVPPQVVLIQMADIHR